ncbi:MAG: putative monovalent cation/H+ antiporter subunit A [Verrucomicrobiota bacterium]
MLPAVVFSCFVAAAAAPGLHRVLKEKAGWILAAWALALFAVMASFLPLVTRGEEIRVAIPWVPRLGVDLSFYLDGLGLLMALLITGIGALIALYSSSYLKGDSRLGRFYMSLMLFMGSMLGVVLADNLIVLFIFWELTSVTSYLLIGYNHHEASSRKAALQALLVTGSGGLALLAGLVLIYLVTGSYEFTELMQNPNALLESSWYLPILILVLAGAFTKSAQVPFHFWLPSAMAAPTPVSAYLHSATMVKAGVFLLAHLQPLLGGTALWTTILTTFGGATLCFAGYQALTQRDLKKILAYSTVSTLGLLVFLLGIGTEKATQAAIGFLLAHALYKAGLFLVAGIIDHETGTRDITILRGLRRALPVTAVAAALVGLSNAGFPGLFGFIGKELAYMASWYNPSFAALALVAVLGNICLVGVGFLVGFVPFWGKPPGEHVLPKHPHEAPALMWIAPLTLGLCSLGFGLVPGMLDGLVGAAAEASWGAAFAKEVHLAIWHGWNWPLALSVLTFLAGIAVVMLRWNIYALRDAMGGMVQALGPSRGYDLIFDAVVRFSKWQTRVFQNGYYRHYVMIFYGGVTALVLLAMWRLGFAPSAEGPFELPHFYEYVVVGLMIVSLLVTIATKNRWTAIVALSVVGFGVAIIFVLYGAPDLAITQILVETLTLILLAVVIFRLPEFKGLSPRRLRGRDAVLSAAFGVVMMVMVQMANVIQVDPPISEEFAEISATEAFGRNVVNVILVDFRVLDTMGEIIVLAVAALGVWALLRFPQKHRRKEFNHL